MTRRLKLITSLVVQLLLVGQLWAMNDVTTYRTTDEDAPWHPIRLQQDSHGLIWIGSWNGLYRFDGYHFQSFKPEPGQGTEIDNDRIRDIMMAGGDSLLCRFDEGVYVFDIGRCQFSSLPDSLQADFEQRMTLANDNWTARPVEVDGQIYPDIQQSFFDRQGNQWLKGIDRIYCIHPNQRHGSMIEGSESLSMPRRLYRDTEGCYWVCSRDNRQVVLFDAEWNRIGYLGQDGTLHDRPTAFAPIYCVFDNGRGTVWLGSKPDGLYRLTRHGKHQFKVEQVPLAPLPNGIPSNAIYDIQEDKLGTLWMASWDEGVICLDNPNEPDIKALHYISMAQHCPQYPSEALKTRRIAIRPDGTMLVTSTRGMLIIENIYTSPSQFVMHLHRREANRRESLSSSAAMAMAFDKNDYLYVATESGGINVSTTTDLHADQLDFRHVTAREGLTSDVILELVNTTSGHILAVSPNGISAIDVDHKTIESYGPQFWNTSAPFTECVPQIIGDSMLILVHEEGIIRQPLRELTHQDYAPYIALTSVAIASEPTRYDVDRCDTLRLTSQQRSLVLNFAALDLRSNRSLRYRTRFTPDGETPGDWSHASDVHEVQLQDLRPGKYELQIWSSNAHGQWADNVRTVCIIVEPRFFEAWYGQALLWLLFAIIVASITSLVMYVRRIDNKRHELLQTYLALLESTTKEKIASAASMASARQIDRDVNAPDTPSSPVLPAQEARPFNALQPVEAPQPAAERTMSPLSAISTTHLSVIEQQFMQRLIDYVEQNISNCNASLADMAEATATSKSSLTRKTHQLLGVTPADFLKEARLKHASHLLLTTTQSLSEIALACGFSDPKYFSKCFKASTGKTPTEYRS